MSQIIQKCIFHTLSAKYPNEHFNTTENSIYEMNKLQLISFVLSLIVSQLLLLLVGKWLWNTYLVSVTDHVKPIDSIWHILGISVLLKLLIN